jgi:hypothetical protein
LTQLQKQLEEIPKIKEQIQKQTPEQVQSVLDKSVEIDSLYSKINSVHASVAETNEIINASLQTTNENLLQSNNIVKNLKQLNDKSDKFLQTTEVSVTQIGNLLENSTKISNDLDITIADIKAKNKKLEEINSIHETSEELKEKIDLAYTNIDKNFKEINSLHLKIFGYIKKDEKGENLKVKGFKDELDESYSQLTSELAELHEEIHTTISESQSTCLNVQKHWETEHLSLKKRIEILLPGALTAGLSTAYKEKKDSEVGSMEQSNNSFQTAIKGLVAVSLIPFAISVYLLTQGNTLEDTILKLPRMVMAILPLYIPVLWIAYSSSKKVNLSKRLIEEYSHKEALSKTFEGLSGQVNNIKDSQEKDELKAKLLYNLLEVSAENPGKLIYDYNNADHPLMDALDKSVKLSDAITKIASIPGMSKLSNILVEKDKKIKEEIGEKAAEGLEASEAVR